MHVAVVGAGIFGVTAAVALARRGCRVTLLDPGPVPHPLAESTDISKVVRMDYGADETYAEWMDRALEGWRRWNHDLGEVLFHESGLVYLTRQPMERGGFERDSFATLTRRGHALERLDAREIARRFPAWNARLFVDGYFNPVGGWAASGAVVSRLVALARELGVDVRANARVVSVDERRADVVIVAAGAWTPSIVPAIADRLRTVGQPVFHLAPRDAAAFAAARFPVFGADIAKTGWYGFPANAAGIVKIANHGAGRAMHPDAAERVVTEEETRALRGFLREAFPTLADAPIASTRVCVYCDTEDEHFFIARDPERPWLVVATGGSGHAFKFAPLLGDWIADAAAGEPVPERFRWREARGTRGEEAARAR